MLPNWMVYIFGTSLFGVILLIVMVMLGVPLKETDSNPLPYVLAALGGFVVIHLMLRRTKLTPQQETERQERIRIAQLEKRRQDAQIVCCHCQTKGNVVTERVQVDDKKPLSSGDLGAARLTGGLNLVVNAIGDMIPEFGTIAHCDNCG